MFGVGRVTSGGLAPGGAPTNLSITRQEDPYTGAACGTTATVTWTAGTGNTPTSYSISWAATDGTTGAGNSGSVTGIATTTYTFSNGSFVYNKNYVITVTQNFSGGSASSFCFLPRQINCKVQYLLIGGGGGGGNFIGGGGGAGGFCDSTDQGNDSFELLGDTLGFSGTNRIYVGLGGGSNSEGQASYMYTRNDATQVEYRRIAGERGGLGGRAIGGPAGGYPATGGGSGGGGAGANNTTGAPGTYPGSTFSSKARQGYNGGNGAGEGGGAKASGGGGGGAGAQGGNASLVGGLYLQPGAGGAGKASSITGTAVTHCGGGGGGGDDQVGYSAAGGSGGGGTGFTDKNGGNATGGPNTSWTASHGSGGGGAGAGNSRTGGSGYQGAIFIAYPTSYPALSRIDGATLNTHYIYSNSIKSGYHLYKFFTNPTSEWAIGWTPNSFGLAFSADVEILAGGGGGGGGANGMYEFYAGAGGAGGYLSLSSISLVAGISYDVTVGDGGAGGAANGVTVDGTTGGVGENGQNSVFFGNTAIGGGGGSYGFGNSGGCGGGSAGAFNRTTGGLGTAGPPRQGYNGGNGSWSGATVNNGGGGGGGGIGGAGTSYGGNGTGAGSTQPGGIGLTFVTDSISRGVGGTANGTAVDAAANTGNGGNSGKHGPSGSGATAGRKGGSGIVIIKYPSSIGNPVISGTLTSSQTTSGSFNILKLLSGTGNIQWL